MNPLKYEVRYLERSEYKEWDSFVDNSPQGCIFCRSWWLEAVCPKGFRILVLRKDGKIVAGMPLPIREVKGHKFIYMPKFTQTLGLLLPSLSTERYEKKLSYEMSTMNTFVGNMPKLDYFSMSFHYSFANWLPFYWAGYSQTTGYTYVIENLTDLNKVFSAFNYSKRKNIKKAERLVSVHTDLPAREFYTNHVLTLNKQGKRISYSFDCLKRMHDAVYENGSGKTWYALDDQKNIHAAIFVVFDRKSAYYLISTIDPDYRNSGAATLLLKDAIAYVSQYTKRFDFEGSMIREVESSFRKFGALQKPYFIISKANLWVKCFLRLHNLTIKTLGRLKL